MAKAGNQGKRKSVAGTTKESGEDRSDSQRNVAEGKLEPEPENGKRGRPKRKRKAGRGNVIHKEE